MDKNTGPISSINERSGILKTLMIPSLVMKMAHMIVVCVESILWSNCKANVSYDVRVKLSYGVHTLSVSEVWVRSPHCIQRPYPQDMQVINARETSAQTTPRLSNFLISNGQAACKEHTLFTWKALIGRINMEDFRGVQKGWTCTVRLHLVTLTHACGKTVHEHFCPGSCDWGFTITCRFNIFNIFLKLIMKNKSFETYIC